MFICTSMAPEGRPLLLARASSLVLAWSKSITQASFSCPSADNGEAIGSSPTPRCRGVRVTGLLCVEQGELGFGESGEGSERRVIKGFVEAEFRRLRA